ncbi:MAG: hypothetical protein QW838_04145 [Candidatus Nitrosotenuis sp.]
MAEGRQRPAGSGARKTRGGSKSASPSSAPKPSGAEGFRKLDSELIREGRETPAPPPDPEEPENLHRPILLQGLEIYGPAIRRPKGPQTFASFQRYAAMEKAYLAALAVAEERVWSAFLWSGEGHLGCGKTHLARAACERFRERGRVAWFWKTPDLLAWIRSRIGAKQYEPEYAYGKLMWEPPPSLWTADDAVRFWTQADGLLALDDYGAHQPTDWAAEQLYRILDGRYERRKPTILTSNAPFDLIDPRIFSRYQRGLVICEGRDYRARLDD